MNEEQKKQFKEGINTTLHEMTEIVKNFEKINGKVLANALIVMTNLDTIHTSIHMLFEQYNLPASAHEGICKLFGESLDTSFYMLLRATGVEEDKLEELVKHAHALSVRAFVPIKGIRHD